MTPQQQVIDHINALVDTYHALSHPAELGALWRIRRDIVAASSHLARHVKQGYGKKVLSYAIQKHQIAKEILAAMEIDKVAAGKGRPMTTLVVYAGALNSVLEKIQDRAEADGEWEEITETLKVVSNVLFAMSQEIQDGMRERGYQKHLEGLQAKNISEDQQRHEQF